MSSLDWCRVCRHIRWYHGLILSAKMGAADECLSCSARGDDAAHEFRLALEDAA